MAESPRRQHSRENFRSSASLLPETEREGGFAEVAGPRSCKAARVRLSNTSICAVLGTLLAFAACGGNEFGSDGVEAAVSGASGTPHNTSSSGSEGSAIADAGEASASGGTAATTGGRPAIAGASSQAGTSSDVSGGSSGVGGSDDAAGGEASVPPAPVFTVSKMIDDMEDGNATLLETNGDWFVFKDATSGTISPAKGVPFVMSALSPARGASKMAAAVTVSGFTDWGAAFGFDFSYVTGVRQQTDLGPALAVRFYAKANKPTSVRFQVPNADTDTLGGKCSGTGDSACNAHWSKVFAVGTAWTETTISFSDLRQDLPGRHVASFDKRHVYSTFFVIGPNQSVTVWIDDIALVH